VFNETAGSVGEACRLSADKDKNRADDAILAPWDFAASEIPFGRRL
jgi:hypothetical protein